MTLEISFLVSNSYELMGLKSLLCQHYKGDPQKICFLPASQPPSDERVSITFRDDVVTLTLPEYCGSTQSLLPRKNTATWHIPLLSRNCPLDDIAIKIKNTLPCWRGGPPAYARKSAKMPQLHSTFGNRISSTGVDRTGLGSAAYLTGVKPFTENHQYSLP